MKERGEIEEVTAEHIVPVTSYSFLFILYSSGGVYKFIAKKYEN